MKIHTHENNSESQQHLEANKKHFSQQCLKVLELLLQGKRLTTANAPSYKILSLPRRLKDLRENGIFVDEEWILDDTGKKVMKQWFIQERTQNEKRDLQKFLNSFQHESESPQPLPKNKLPEQSQLF